MNWKQGFLTSLRYNQPFLPVPSAGISSIHYWYSMVFWTRCKAPTPPVTKNVLTSGGLC